MMRPLMMLIRVLPSAMISTWFHSPGLITDFSSSEVPSVASRVGFLPGSVATTWPRQAMIPRGELLLVELAGIFVVVIEVRLIAAKIPLGVLAIEILLFLPLLFVARE